ncbi:MAG TPA: hypothetical protein VEF35_04230 [Candidatus Bathyarchaeia archaeon]|nr:hypothetical protein [Candidatus Bathyarchaeia archaeon]
MEVREKMHEKKRTENPLKWFILPNESYKWDFILDKYAGEEADQEAAPERRGIEKLGDDGFDKDYVITRRRRKQWGRYCY